MTTQRIKGLTQPLPPNSVIGRLGNGGAPQVINIAQIAAMVARSGQVAPAGSVASTGANPTATASDTAVNGSATTFMRSDAAPAVQKGSATQYGLLKVDGSTITATLGVISAVLRVGANPSATASDAAVNGSAVTFMRSDAAPAVQKASSSVFGLVKVDNSTITASGGVITAATQSKALSALTDVSVTEGAGIDGYVLYWNNGATKWEAEALATVATTGAYSDLSGQPILVQYMTGLLDVNVPDSSGIDGYYLAWDNGTLKWIARNTIDAMAIGVTTPAPGNFTTLTGNANFSINKSGAALILPAIVSLQEADGVQAGFIMQSSSAACAADFYRTGGTWASRVALAGGTTIGTANFGGYDGTGNSFSAARISASTGENWSNTAHGTYISLQTTALTTLTLKERVRVQPSGGVTIGNSIIATDPGDGCLMLSGTARIGSFTVGTLPAAGSAGRIAYVSNLRVFVAGVQQGAGLGTGGIAIDNATAWKNADDQGTTAVA